MFLQLVLIPFLIQIDSNLFAKIQFSNLNIFDK